jgi:hypothetical protein
MRDASKNKTGTASKKGPMTKKHEDVQKMHEESKTSENFTMAEKSESTTNRLSKKSSQTFRGDFLKNVENPFLQKPIRAATPTPEKKPEVHRTSKGKQGSRPPVPHLGETGEVNKVRHPGTMSHCDSQTKENIRPITNDTSPTPATKTERKQLGEQSKEEIEQALAECRKRCGIVPGQMAVLKDPSPQIDQVEQPWMKWTSEEKEKAFQEFRERAGIIPHKKQVAEAIANAMSPNTDTRNPVAYAPKPTHSPNVATQQESDNGIKDCNSDTHMHDVTAEEEKSSTHPSKNSQHMVVAKKVTWAK